MNYEKLLRAIRLHPALWGEMGQGKETQACRIRDKCKARLAPKWLERKAELEHSKGQRLLRLWD